MWIATLWLTLVAEIQVNGMELEVEEIRVDVTTAPEVEETRVDVALAMEEEDVIVVEEVEEVMTEGR